ncbi:MAG: hypothetical protein Q9168_004334 [Polycauliona sp. 1 TL-2023]
MQPALNLTINVVCDKCYRHQEYRRHHAAPAPPAPAPITKHEIAKVVKCSSEHHGYNIISPTFTYDFPRSQQHPFANSHDDEETEAEKHKAVTEANTLFLNDLHGLNHLCRLFRRQVVRARHPGFHAEINKLEDKAIAWMKEMRELDRKRVGLQRYLW